MDREVIALNSKLRRITFFSPNNSGSLDFTKDDSPPPPFFDKGEEPLDFFDVEGVLSISMYSFIGDNLSRD